MTSLLLKKVFEMWSEHNSLHTCSKLSIKLIKYSLRRTIVLGSAQVLMQTLALFLLDIINTIFTSFLPNAVTCSSPSQWLIFWQYSILIASRNSAFWPLKHNPFLSLLTVTLLYFIGLSYSVSSPLNAIGLKDSLPPPFFFVFELSPCIISYTPKASFPAKNKQFPRIFLQANNSQLPTTPFTWKMETDLFIFFISLNTQQSTWYTVHVRQMRAYSQP